MKLPLKNVLLSAADGLVQSDNQIWYHFNKYNWNISQKGNNLEDEKFKHLIKTRLGKGLPEPSGAKVLYGTYHLGISPHIYSYYHFISDLLPHLIFSPNYPILVPEFMPIFYNDFLRKIGFEIKILPPKVYLVEKLFIPKIDKTDWNRGKIKIIQNFFKKIFPTEFSSIKNNYKYQKKIYVSRKLAKKRHLSNEDLFLPILKKHNFKKVFLEKMTVQEQVKLFRSISHIIAPHGAGLTNILFAPSDTKILEVRPILSSGNYCFEKLFSMGWPNYDIIIPPQVGHFFLPVKDLEDVLEKWRNE